jgi:hypothetical protein
MKNKRNERTPEWMEAQRRKIINETLGSFVPDAGTLDAWSVYKVLADGSEKLVADFLPLVQAKELAIHYYVGCLEGETVRLRAFVLTK